MARRLRRKLAFKVALAVLVPLYLVAALAGFVAPYHFDHQSRAIGWCEPMLGDVHWRWQGRFVGPYVHGIREAKDRFGIDASSSDPGAAHRIRLFVPGDEYWLLGCLGPFRTHLLGLDPTPIGAERTQSALDDVRLPESSVLAHATLAEIAAELSRRSGVAVDVDRSAEFQDYLRDAPLLDVDLGGKTLRQALAAIVESHRSADEGSKLIWLLRPEGVMLGSRALTPEPRLYLLGSDALGRDLFSRIVYGAQVSLTVGLVGISVTLILGLLLGGIAGYAGGGVDFLLMRLVDLLMAVPAFYLILVLRGLVRSDLDPLQAYLLVTLILALVSWGSFARLVRGSVLSLREQEFTTAARALGASHWRCLVRHILPNTLTLALVQVTLAIPYFILGEVALSFLGLGIAEPGASWGNLLQAATNVSALAQHPWVLWPGAFIFASVLAYNFLGDALRDATDPRTAPGPS
jgi:ABC-type dipeptide/oligopeptide/nickel transport system permease subunit